MSGKQAQKSAVLRAAEELIGISATSAPSTTPSSKTSTTTSPTTAPRVENLDRERKQISHQQNAHDPIVAKIQSDLIALNISVGKSGADGKRGPNTIKGAIEFETKYGLNPDGNLEPNELKLLHEQAQEAREKAAVTAVIIRPSTKTKGFINQQVQEFLESHDYPIGKKPDGFLEDNTIFALNRWQREHNLTETNGLNVETLNAMGIEIRTVSESLVNFVKEKEKLRTKAYKCPAGKWTIGYGHTEGVRPGMTITAEEADRTLRDDLAKKALYVQQRISTPLDQLGFDGAVSFTQNKGQAWMFLDKDRKYSDLYIALEQNKDLETAEKIMKLYTKGGGRKLDGLVTRSKEEGGMLRGKIPEFYKEDKGNIHASINTKKY